MNNSTIAKLNKKYSITIDSPTIQHYSGSSYKMAFEIYMDGNNSICVLVKANEPIYKAIERTLASRTTITSSRSA